MAAKKPTFSLSQMSRMMLASSLPWREKVVAKKPTFSISRKQSHACMNYAEARKGGCEEAKSQLHQLIKLCAKLVRTGRRAGHISDNRTVSPAGD